MSGTPEPVAGPHTMDRGADGVLARQLQAGLVHGERWLRIVAEDHVRHMIEAVLAECSEEAWAWGELTPTRPAAVWVAANAGRLVGVAESVAFVRWLHAHEQCAEQFRARGSVCFGGTRVMAGRAVSGKDVAGHLEWLRRRHPWSSDDGDTERLRTLLQDASVVLDDPDDRVALLAQFPEVRGGLHSIGSGVLHRQPDIRVSTALLLQKLEDDPRPFVSGAVASLNYMLLTAYQHVVDSKKAAPAPNPFGGTMRGSDADRGEETGDRGREEDDGNVGAGDEGDDTDSDASATPSPLPAVAGSGALDLHSSEDSDGGV